VVGDIADVKHALAVRLTSDDFATALAAVDDEKADGIATPVPTAVFESEKVNLSDVGYPVGELIAVKTVYEQQGDAKLAVHEIHIFWTQTGDDELTITQNVERLVRATRDLFWPTDPMTGVTQRISLPEVHSGPIVFVSEDYTALAPKVNKTGFVKGSWTVLLVTTVTV
jgi:hypothetical protein